MIASIDFILRHYRRTDLRLHLLRLPPPPPSPPLPRGL